MAKRKGKADDEAPEKSSKNELRRQPRSYGGQTEGGVPLVRSDSEKFPDKDKEPRKDGEGDEESNPVPA